MKITVVDYPCTFSFEVSVVLPAFKYGCKTRGLLLAEAMKDQKIDSPMHGYEDYVVEDIERFDKNGKTAWGKKVVAEKWHLGS